MSSPASESFTMGPVWAIEVISVDASGYTLIGRIIPNSFPSLSKYNQALV